MSLIVLSFALSGCASMTTDQKVVAGIVVGALVVGAINASQSDSADKCKPAPITWPNDSGFTMAGGC